MSEDNPAGLETSGTTTEVEQLKNELEALRQEFHNYRNAVSKKFSGHEDELEELEARFEDETPTPDGDETGSDGPDMLPIERLAKLKESDDERENPFSNTTASVDRAAVIYQHFRNWSSKAPKGRVIKSGLKELLETATGESLFWKQVQRACRKLEEWTKGAIAFEKNRRHGWILVDKRSSSVRRG